MAKYTNAQIAGNLSLWNEYFNTSALMTDEEFYAMSYDQRLQMLVDAFGEDEADENEEDTMNSTINRGVAAEEALNILCMFRGDLVPEMSYAESLTGTTSNWHHDMVLADIYIALIEGMMDDDEDEGVTVAPISTGDALEIWRKACDEYGVSYDAPDADEWIRIRIKEREATEMTAGVVTELVVPAGGY